MLKLRLKLKDDIYWFRWELCGSYTCWVKGTRQRLATVNQAKQLAFDAPILGE